MIEPLQTPKPIPQIRPGRPEVDQLGERIAELSAQIQAATYHLLVMIREFDERGGWNTGFRSCAHWLNWRTGLDLGAAREKVRVAKALGELPKLSEAMRCGELSYSKVRALTRVATAENEAELLEFAQVGTAAHVETLVRAWRRVDRRDELEHENLRHSSRYLQAYTDEDGMVVLQARLDPENGAAVLKALEEAEQVLYDKERETKDKRGDGVPVGQRRADALGLVAESALASGLDKGTRGDRLQVVVHVDSQVLEDSSQPGVSMLEDGTDVSAETSRRLGCDTGKVVMQHDSEGKILDVGRRTRTIPTAIRRALTARDEGCQFPGCGLKYCEAHHLKHWANGGETSLDNLVLLCRRHHRAVHEEGYRIEGSPDGELRFFRPQGWEIPSAPPAPALPQDPLESLSDLLDEEGVSIDASTGFPTWDGGRLDLHWA
ncbi:MAG: DUF222 domain-containing protein, partial [Thermoanaerobaculia bacterium]